MLSLEDIQDILRIKLIGVIPESETVLQRLQPGRAGHPRQGHRRVRGLHGRGRRFLGEDQPMRFIEAEKPGLFKRLFGGSKPWRPSSPSCSAKRRRRPSVAKERLQIILARALEPRAAGMRPDYLPTLQRELVAVISKYVSINPEDIKVHLERQDDLDVLDIKIELPDATLAPAR